MKRNLAIILIIVSFMVLPLSAYADTAAAPTTSTTAAASTTLTIANKADVLNKLTILQGTTTASGTDYNLSGTLIRSQAVAFIVRIMGQEANVKTNAAKYPATQFSDVKANDWFAPYVGYCVSQGILEGLPDGGFHPNDAISEKAFLKLILGALGYTYNTDFVWDTIDESAYNLGLVTDIKYKTQTADNTNYLRSDVVSALYNALIVPFKKSTSTIISTLLAAKVVSAATLTQLGFAVPATTTSIVSAVAGQNTLKVVLNQTINTLTDSNIQIYETGNTTNLLTASIQSQMDQTIIINTSVQKPNQSYTLQISSIATEFGGPAALTTTFTGFVIPESQSALFRINKVVPISSKIINVYYTQPVTQFSALPIYYDLMKGNSSFVQGNHANLSVKLLPGNPNAVSLYLLNDTIADNTSAYTLQINGDLTSAYGINLNNGAGDAMTFTANATANGPFKILSALQITSNSIRVDFNEAVDPSTVNQLGNYQIVGSDGLQKTVTGAMLPASGNGQTLILNVSTPIALGVNYQLSISNVRDIYDATILPTASFNFVGQTLASPNLSIVNVSAVDQSTLKVYFNRNVDAVSAQNIGYYTIQGQGTGNTYFALPAKVYYSSSEPFVVYLMMPIGKELLSTNSYKLQVLSSLLDEQGNASSTNLTSSLFAGSSTAAAKPTFTSAVVIGQNTIKLTSAQVLYPTGSNVLTSNYTLQSNQSSNTVTIKTPTDVSMYDGNTIIIKFDQLDSTQSYTLKFNSLTDYSGTRIRTASDGANTIPVTFGN